MWVGVGVWGWGERERERERTRKVANAAANTETGSEKRIRKEGKVSVTDDLCGKVGHM
jgi:hypothetical protein